LPPHSTTSAIVEGTVKAINVKEGDRIQKGDVLIERDSDLPQAGVDRLEICPIDSGRLEAFGIRTNWRSSYRHESPRSTFLTFAKTVGLLL